MGGDLHCHTKLSDGSLGIEDLVLLAKKKGIETIAITDHDCIAGTVRGKIIGDRYGVNVIPGVELSSRDEKTGKYVDILCYLSDAPDRLQGLCHKNSLARKKAAHFMMLQITKRYPVSAEFIIKCATGSTNIFIPHIMQALMESGYTNTIFGDLYNKLFNKESDGNILVTPKYPDIEEVVGAIHDAGGIAVLAHPYLYENIDSIPRLIECGIDGIEVWHPSATEAQRA
ncbi:MAG: PHP domain-containing protein [Oscillospiraceae bacterium]|nr:PHP domain-containing protein [Oscillospiraceae bacterium]